MDGLSLPPGFTVVVQTRLTLGIHPEQSLCSYGLTFFFMKS